MDAARASEARWAKGAPLGIDGLPVGIKDESYVLSKPTSNGSLIMKDFVADHTSVMNERILNGINMPEPLHRNFLAPGSRFAVGGVTRNPWNPEFTPVVPRAALQPLSLPGHRPSPPDRTLAAQSASQPPAVV